MNRNFKEIADFVYMRNLEPEGLAPLERKLFDFAIEEDDFCDRQAQLTLYGKLKTTSTYRVIKKHLYERLLNAIMNMRSDPADHSEYFIESDWCHQRLQLIYRLYSFGLRNAALRLTQKLYTKAEHYHLYDICLTCLKYLLQHYAYTGDTKCYSEIRQRYQELNRIVAAEHRCELLLQDVILALAHTVSPTAETIGTAENIVNELAVLQREHDTRTLNLAYFRAHMFLENIREHYTNVLKISSQALDFLKSKPHLAQNRYFIEFYNACMNAFLHLGEVHNARFTIKLCLPYTSNKKQTWFNYQKRRFLLAMHTGAYDDARAALSEVLANRRLRNLPSYPRQQWAIFRAYQLFVERRQDYSNPAGERREMEQLFREAGLIRNDKAGWNISLQVIRILFYIKWNDLDRLEDYYETLQTYCSRYLYKNETYRSQVFIRMLLLIAKESGNYKRVDRLGRQWLRKLGKGERLIDECEIIPYETLWSWVLTSLHTDIPEHSRYEYDLNASAPRMELA